MLIDLAPSTDKKVEAQRLADIFTALQRCFVVNLSKELGRGGVSFAQYFLLGFMAHEGKPLSMTEIATRMRHTTAAATGLIDRLEKLSYVKRQPSKEDRRKIYVLITKKGLELVFRVRDDMANNVVRLMGLLTVQEQEAWKSIYEKIYTAMSLEPQPHAGLAEMLTPEA